MRDDLETLKAEARAIARKIDRIESAAARERSAEFVGRFFKYRNSYSCPEKPSDYWWLYCKVIGSDAYSVKVFQFQSDNRGRHEAETTTRHNSMSGYVEIKRAEYERARDAFLRKVERDAAQ